MQALYGAVVFVLMRIPFVTWCVGRSKPAGYDHQTESVSSVYQQPQQASDMMSLDSSQSKLQANDLSQQIIINSAQVHTVVWDVFSVEGGEGACAMNT